MNKRYNSIQQCGANSECVPYYLCENGMINTDGSGLLDIRFGEEKPCLDYFEQCCEAGNILPPDTKPTQGPPVVPNQDKGPQVVPEEHKPCGFRNTEGVGFKITGNNDFESEYGKRVKQLDFAKDFLIFISSRRIPMDDGNLEGRES